MLKTSVCFYDKNGGTVVVMRDTEISLGGMWDEYKLEHLTGLLNGVDRTLPEVQFFLLEKFMVFFGKKTGRDRAQQGGSRQLVPHSGYDLDYAGTRRREYRLGRGQIHICGQVRSSSNNKAAPSSSIKI